MSARRWVPAVLTGALLAPAMAPAAAAGALGLNVQSAGLPALAPGRTVTTAVPSPIAIAALALEPWTLKVSDDSAGGTAGRLTRASATGACAASEPALATPLHLSSTSVLASLDAPELNLSGTPVTVAHGTTAATVAVSFTQAIGQMEPIAAGCTYQTTVTWTVIGG